MEKIVRAGPSVLIFCSPFLVDKVQTENNNANSSYFNESYVELDNKFLSHKTVRSHHFNEL